MLLSPSLPRQMEIISFSHCSLPLVSLTPLSNLSQPNLRHYFSHLFTHLSNIYPPQPNPTPLRPHISFAPHLVSLFISLYTDLYRKVSNSCGNRTTWTSASSLLSEVLTGVMTHTCPDSKNWWGTIRLILEWTGRPQSLRTSLRPETDAWTPTVRSSFFTCTNNNWKCFVSHPSPSTISY